MLIKRGPLFHFIAITLAFLILGVAVFLPLLGAINESPVLFYVALGIYVFVYVAALIATMVRLHFKKKKNQ